MKKVLLRLSLYLAGMGLAVFIGIFIWANWTPLSPGEKADPVNFTLFDVSTVKNQQQLKQLNAYIMGMDGVKDVLYSPPLKSIVVTYKVLETSEYDIVTGAKEDMNYDLRLKEIQDNGKRKCPMKSSLTMMSRIRRTLNCRG